MLLFDVCIVPISSINATILIERDNFNLKDLMTLLQFDDPNATISRILEALRSKNISITFPPNKLKTGAGEQCLYVLDKLADLALAVEQFSWIK